MKKYFISSVIVAVMLLVATPVMASGEVGEITYPVDGSVVSGMVTFTATYTDDDPEGVDWAVRSGTCSMNDTYTVFGNVGGFSDNYTWENGLFAFITDVSGLSSGDYCFIFNPKEGSGDDDVRETQWFVVDNTAPLVDITAPADTDVLQGNVDIVGSVTDDVELSHYNLSLYPASTDLSDGETHSSDRLADSGGCLGNTVTLTGDIVGATLCSVWDTTQYIDGDYQIRLAARDAVGNRDTSDPYTGNTTSVHVIGITIDNPPAMPTGLERYAPNEDRVYACGDVSLIQKMWPDWADNAEDDFSHYEYSSFNPGAQGIDEREFTVPRFAYIGSWLPGFGTYGYAVRAVDEVGNKSAWALSDETLEGSCQITYIGELSATPLVAHNPVNTKHTVTADINSDVEGVNILFGVAGANTESGTTATDANGLASFTYMGANAGADAITVCVDENWDTVCNEYEQSVEVAKHWYEPSVHGGGQIIEENDSKRTKDWLRVSFGGSVNALGGHGLVGEWQVNLHNVGDDNLDKSKFHGSEVVVLNMFDGDSPTCNDAVNFTINGTLDGDTGHSMIFRAGDLGSPNTADTVRVTIYDGLNGTGGVVYDSHGGDFTDESTCVGTARTGLDRGNITIFNN